MSLRECISKLRKNKKVYICDSPMFSDKNWQLFQEREKAFWEYEINRPTYNPDPKEHIKPSLERWGIDTSYFRDKAALEIGSGPFGFFAGVSQINKDHLPKDLVVSDSLMDFYQKFKISDLIPENAVRLQAPGEDMPFADGSFDVILTDNTIDHVNDCDRLLQEIRRLLRPDGVLLFSSHILVGCVRPFKPLIKLVDLNHPHHFTRGEIDDLFDRNGFHLGSHTSIPLYESEEAIPPEASLFKKCVYFVGFRVMHTLYGVGKLKGRSR